MSYSDFTLDMLRRSFGIVVRDQAFFRPVGNLAPSAWLQQALKQGASPALVSEKARSEFIIAPTLVACEEFLNHRFRIFSGIRLDVDADKGLKGECDFILARSASAIVLEAPLMLVLEAKKQDIEEGVGQCAAQMLAAKIYNEREGLPIPFLYGCVTTGETWQFLKLDDAKLLVDPERLTLKEIAKVLWMLAQCIQDADKHVPAAAPV